MNLNNVNKFTKKFWYIAGLFCVLSFLMVVIICLLNARYSERPQNLFGLWQVTSIRINKLDVIDDFSIRKISFKKNYEIRLPKIKDFKYPKGALYNCKWAFKRVGFIDGTITIEDDNQYLFSGIYNIKIIKYGNPQIIRLNSDSIEIYLQEYDNFSINNRSIDAFNFDN